MIQPIFQAKHETPSYRKANIQPIIHTKTTLKNSYVFSPCFSQHFPESSGSFCFPSPFRFHLHGTCSMLPLTSGPAAKMPGCLWTISKASIIEKTGWWLNQPIWKICSSNWKYSPNRGANKTYLKPPPRKWWYPWDGTIGKINRLDTPDKLWVFIGSQSPKGFLGLFWFYK